MELVIIGNWYLQYSICAAPAQRINTAPALAPAVQRSFFLASTVQYIKKLRRLFNIDA